MGFNKKIISKKTIEQFDYDTNMYNILKKYDCFIFENEEIKRKFKLLENEYLEKKNIK